MKRLIFLAALLAPGPARAFSPLTEKIQHDGEVALYNLDYDRAREEFSKLINQEPENAYGYLLEAASIWWQASNEYDLFKDTPTLESQFEQDIDTALDKAKAALKSANDPQSQVEANFVEGMAMGARGQWNLLRGHWVKAYFDGKHAIHHLNRCLKINPAFYDAYLGLGVYDYQTAKLPGILKLSSLMMVRGNAPRGLERLHLAQERGHYSSVQAALFLVDIYLSDAHDDAEALKLVESLKSLFPESPYLAFLEVITRNDLHQFDASFEAAKPLLQKAVSDPSVLQRKQLSIICGVFGSKCLSQSALTQAVEWFTAAIDKQSKEPKSAMMTLLYFYRATALDILGERSRALDDYYQTNASPPLGDLQDEARRCIEDPCTRDDVLKTLKTKSL